jgi:hypothetical protein
MTFVNTGAAIRLQFSCTSQERKNFPQSLLQRKSVGLIWRKDHGAIPGQDSDAQLRKFFLSYLKNRALPQITVRNRA